MKQGVNPDDSIDKVLALLKEDTEESFKEAMGVLWRCKRKGPDYQRIMISPNIGDILGMCCWNKFGPEVNRQVAETLIYLSSKSQVQIPQEVLAEAEEIKKSTAIQENPEDR